MDLKVATFLLTVLIISWKSAYANTTLIDIPIPVNSPRIERNGGGHEQLCTVCQDFTAQATTFLKENKTRSEILDILHNACSQLQSLELKCVILVDYYSALFFASLDKIRPEEFCEKVGLCKTSSVSIVKDEEKCKLCHRVVVEILLKLKDPDAQLEVFQMLFRKCDKMGNYAHECKRLVMQYGPYILINGEDFLERNDVCSSFHACHSGKGELIGAIPLPGSSVLDF